MPQTLYNGAMVPTNGEGYDLLADWVKMCLSMNVPIPVDSLEHRNALAGLAGGVLPPGTMVLRKDQSMFIEKWDGTNWKTSAHCEWTRSAQVVPTATVWGVGALTLDATKTTDSAFVTHPAGDQIKFRDAGTYAITFTAKTTTSTSGRAFVEFQTGGEAIIRTVMTGEDRGAAVIANYRATADQVLTFDVYQTSGGNMTYDFRIRITRTA